MAPNEQQAMATPAGIAGVEAQVVGEIRHSVFVRATPERVYDAMTTAEGLDGWFTSGTMGIGTPRPQSKHRLRDRVWRSAGASPPAIACTPRRPWAPAVTT